MAAVLEGRLLRQRRPQPPGDRGGVLPRARRDPGRPRAGGRERGVRRRVRLPAHLRGAVQVRPRDRLLLLLRPDRDRALPERRALRRRRPAVRQQAGRPALQQVRQGRQRRAHPRPRRRRTRRTPASRASAPASRPRWWRSSPAPARSWRWPRCRATTPTSSPRTTSRSVQDRLRAAPGRRLRAAAQPRDPDDAAARLDVQARHGRGGARERQVRRGRRRARRTDVPAPADLRRHRADRQRGPRAAAPTRSRSRRRWHSSVQHHLRRARRRARRRGAARAGGEVRLQPALPHRHRPAGRSRRSPRTPPSRRPGSRASASSRCARPRCRWRWSRPASPTRAR